MYCILLLKKTVVYPWVFPKVCFCTEKNDACICMVIWHCAPIKNRLGLLTRKTSAICEMYGKNVQWISSFQATHNIVIEFLYLSVAMEATCWTDKLNAAMLTRRFTQYNNGNNLFYFSIPMWVHGITYIIYVTNLNSK